MAFMTSMDINASALTAGRVWMDVIAENLANATVTRTADGAPYRRKFVTLQSNATSFDTLFNQSKVRLNGGGISVSRIQEDMSEFKLVYDPQHPDADGDGYVRMPNVDTTKEMIDMIAATRAYEANITALNATKAMAVKALEIGRG